MVHGDDASLLAIAVVLWWVPYVALTLAGAARAWLVRRAASRWRPSEPRHGVGAVRPVCHDWEREGWVA